MNAQKLIFLLYLIFFIFIPTESSLAQNNPKPLYFRSLRQEDGLPSNVTNSIVQDKLGFIWIGTGDGVCRYDGYTTITFKNETGKKILPTNRTSCLLMDGDTLWIGTWKGLCYINTKTLKVNKVNLGPETAIRCLYKSMDHNIWIGTSKGILVYNKTLVKYDFYDSQNSNLSHSTIRCFFQTKDSTMWIGTYHKLNKFKNNSFISYDLKGNYKPFLKNNLILDICPLSSQNDSILAIGTETGLVLFNTNTEKSTLYNNQNSNLSNEVIKCIHIQNNQLWLGTDFGLCIFDWKNKHADSYFHNPIINHSIANNVIWDIFEDYNHILWLLTSNGISIINQSNPLFQLHEEFSTIDNQKVGNQIRDMLIAKDGTLYLATIHGVIAKNKNNKQKVFFTSQSQNNRKLLLDNTYDLIEDKYNRIWIATAGGINIWDPKLKKMFAISSNRSNGLTSNYISCFAITKDGSIWINAWEGGIFKVSENSKDPEKLRFVRVENQTPDFIYACENNIYFQNDNKLWTIDSKYLTAKPVDAINNKIKHQNLQCMNSGNTSTLWIATNEKIIRYRPQLHQSQSFLIQNAVIKNPLNMEVSNMNIVWLTTSNTVIKFNLNTNEILAEPLNPNSPLKSFYNRCSTKSKTGVVYFGGDNGYIETTEKQHLSSTQTTPKSVISLIRINNQTINTQSSHSILKQDIAYSDKLKLDYSNNSITFFFTTLNYWLPNVSNYKFRLINSDKEWRKTQDGNFATYANLRPGNYILEVESTNYAGTKSLKPSRLLIEIHPPFWLCLPMITSYIIFFIALMYVIFKVYLKRQRLNNQLNLANIEKNHNQEIFNSKQQFFTNISHEFRTPLSLITPPLQQVIQSGSLGGKNLEMLKLAEKNSKRLLKLVNQILDFRKLESQSIPIKKENTELIGFCTEIYESFRDIAIRNKIYYKIKSNRDSYFTYIDMEKTEAILYNLIANAFKHTPIGGQIKVNITILTNTEKQAISISISDTGEGIENQELPKIFDHFYQVQSAKDIQQGTGIGLTMAKEYALLLQGDITVKSTIGKGSTFTFCFNSELVQNKEDSIQQYTIAQTTNPLKENFNYNNEQLSKLLIIDDNPDILDYIEMNLNAVFTIYKASNGKEGLEKAINIKPAIIISDIMMPVMDGLEMCTKIKDNKETQHIPVILLTAKSLDIQKTEGMDSGANLYITKPFDIQYLHACINNILKREKQVSDFIRKELLVLPENSDNNKHNQDEIFLKKVMEIIAKNISNPELSVEMISSQIGLSSTHLYRKLKSITNQSTKDILKNYRMQKAAQMIKNKEGNITEIMYHVGFNSLSSFSKSFKKTFGISPKDYG